MADEDFKERGTSFLFFTVAIAAIGGFLYGYHTGIISGALAFITASFHLSIIDQGLAVSIILIGALIGALGSGMLADKYGRKKTTALAALLFVIGSVVSSFSSSFGILLLGRFITGIGVGVVSVVGPMYIGEISPPHRRGLLVSCFQLAITLGILISYIVNYTLSTSGDWRWMLAIGIFPAVIQIFSVIFMPETPAWLFKMGKEKEGIAVLRHLRRDNEWKHHIKEMEAASGDHKRSSWKALFSPHLRYVVMIGLALAIFQQATGINIVFYYAPKIFETVGFGTAQGAILATIGIGVINVIVTCVATFLLDRAGRRILFLISLFGMTCFLVLLSLAYFLNFTQIGIVAFLSIIGYVSFFAIGMGPVTWVILSEIFPLKIRGKAMTIAIFGNWLFNYIVSLTFLPFMETLKSQGTFLLYAVISVLAFWFIYKCIPETKGKTLEEIETLLTKR